MEEYSKLSSLNMRKLHYRIIPAKFVSSKNKHTQSEMFDFWKKNWEKTFAEIGKLPAALNSDSFLRQYEICGLYYNNDLISIFFSDILDLSNRIHIESSFFSEFPEGYWDAAKDKNIKHALFMNNLTVDHDFRGGFGISDIMVGLTLKRAYESNLGHVLCYTRNSRKVDHLVYKWGGQALLKNQTAFGEPTDYIYFERSDLTKIKDHPLYEIVDFLWKNRNHELNQATNLDQILITQGEHNESNEQRNGLQQNAQGSRSTRSEGPQL